VTSQKCSDFKLHSPPSSGEFKNVWSYTSTPQYVFMTWRLIKHRGSFTFYLLYLSPSVTLGRIIHRGNPAKFPSTISKLLKYTELSICKVISYTALENKTLLE